MKSCARPFLLFALVCLSAAAVWSKDPRDSSRTSPYFASKVLQTDQAAILNINNFTTWQRSNGLGQYGPPAVSGDGSRFPRGTRWVLFADGFVWGGKAYSDAALSQVADGQLIRVGGSTYNSGNTPGWISGSGASAVPYGLSDPPVRIYRIRRDWTRMSESELRLDAAENFVLSPEQVTSAEIDSVTAWYALDWDQWPAQYGAPYIERNGQPGYQKPPAFGPSFTVDSLISGRYDEPGISGVDPDAPADQVVWTAMNDLSVGTMFSFVGCKPMGLEAQLTLWGYKRSDALGNMYFKRLRIINKGGADLGGGTKGSLWLDSMYVCQWSDPDLGAFGDDLAGCDSVIGMGFVYNGSTTDAEFVKFGLPPPAVGYAFLAGPIVPGMPSDTGIFDLRFRMGSRHLPMTSFGWYGPGSAISEPTFNYEGALRWWKLFRGYAPDPSTSPDRLWPHGGFQPSFFPFSGEPNPSMTGFVDGVGTNWSFAPGDRRIVMNSGPFVLAPGDTQEVTVAVVGGLGADRFSSVQVMKANARLAQSTFRKLFPSFRWVEPSTVISHPTNDSTEVAIRIRPDAGLAVQSAEVFLEPEFGTEQSLYLPLFDDGAHADSLPGDGVWGNSVRVRNRQTPYRSRLVVRTASDTLTDNAFRTGLQLRPRPELTNWRVVWENGKQDGKVNSGESVLMRFDVRNPDAVNAVQQMSVINRAIPGSS